MWCTQDFGTFDFIHESVTGFILGITEPLTNFLFSAGELPNLSIPFHTVFKLTPIAYGKFVIFLHHCMLAAVIA